jgi:hypothetical protein
MLPLRHARFWRVADGAMLLLVFSAALMPAVWFWNDKVKILSWFQHSDKWLHGMTFFVLAVWFAGQYRRPSYWRIAAGLMLFGFVSLAVATAGIGGWSLRVEDWYSARNTGTSGPTR